MGQEDELWEIEKRSGTYRMGFRKGLKEGRAELRKEREARRQLPNEQILFVLELRGIAVDPSSAARIRAERKPRRLDRWIAVLREVEHVSELFERR